MKIYCIKIVKFLKNKINDCFSNKSIYEGTIKIDELPYSIKYTDNKRELIFENDKLINTRPFIINKNKEIL